MHLDPSPVPTEVNNVLLFFYDDMGAIDNWKLHELEAGDFCVLLRGHLCGTKQALFDHIAAVLQFPSYFGNNWDAFEECLGDLSWLPGASIQVMIDDVNQILSSEENDRRIFWDILASSIKLGVSSFNSVETRRDLKIIIVESAAAKEEAAHTVTSIAHLFRAG